MPRLRDSLALRLALVMTVGLVLLQAAILAVLVWPDGRQLAFRLPSPSDAAAMARALEAAPPEVRPLVVDALSQGPMSVELVPTFPFEPNGVAAQRAPRLGRLFDRYASALEERPFRMQARREASAEVDRVRLLVGLRTGDVMIVQRSQTLVQRFTDRAYVFAFAALAVMVGVFVVSLWTIRPVGVLARAARHIADDVHAPDLPARGVREVRALASALNELKQRVQGLLDDRTRMLAAIAHDLRTYLTRLRLRAEFITDPDQQARAIADLEEMGQLVDDAMLFARDATRAAGDARPVDVAAEIAALAARRRELDQPVRDATAPGAPLTVRASPLALRRMLDNLVDNAIRYGGSATLRARRDGQTVAIAVEDDGPGAPAGDLERMTRPFERLEPSRGRGGGGAGLGLAIVQALAESQGGRLSLENRAEGGLRATIRLPIA
jgi:signal transduction histidine kinase